MMIGFDGALNGGHRVEVRAGCGGENAGEKPGIPHRFVAIGFG